MSNRTLDINCHFLPPPFVEWVQKTGLVMPHMLERARRIPTMVDLSARLAAMDEFPGYAQIPCLAAPPIESYASPAQSPDVARAANESLAELCAAHPQRFPSFVASLPMNNREAILKEARHAVEELNAAGVQIFTNINGRPVDGSDCFDLYELMNKLDRPVWLHPYRDEKFSDYASEKESLYEIWWAFGWPYESAAAMARLVFAGLFDRFPDIKVITHHAGGFVPMLENRLSPGLDVIGNRTATTPKRPRGPQRESIKDAFRRFYADTATFGSALAIDSAVRFFPGNRLLFATDMPFSGVAEAGIRATYEAMDSLGLGEAERDAILIGNAERLLRPALTHKTTEESVAG